ncbi:hypothetical protein CSA56_07960 [candidate division KSB3 bacterium]|uniref:Roadblock/LAMTOR2 domain-containing protein n=1 Tax=candidate division KSB3 bacterium TaxID=2044937 RepID=A0A2G6KFZ3_9BACT|nr:MAG: hypothetical protein CSA56_07960 [candidate division KSB3 bacterium]
MATIELNALEEISGFQAGALVDLESGFALAKVGGGIDLELAAAGNSEVYKAKLNVAEKLGLKEDIEDILISMRSSYHLIRPLQNKTNYFLYLVLNRKKANLAMARHDLKTLEESLDFS